MIGKHVLAISLLAGFTCAGVMAQPVQPNQPAPTTNPLRRPPAAAPAAPATPATDPAPAAAVPERKAPTPAQMAQRSKMKACGAEWQGLKKAAATKGKPWREFASECLKRN
ncbi:MAG: PsiF family protein [Alsobacter sp.]